MGMIRSFSDSRTEHAFHMIFDKRIPHEIAKRVYFKRKNLDVARTLDDLRLPPSNHLELLKGYSVQRYSIRVNDQWRICFTWEQGSSEILDVLLVDYH